MAQAPDASRVPPVSLALCVSSECLDRFDSILRHLVVGLVDHVARIRLISPDPRVEQLSLGPTQAIVQPFPRWPFGHRRIRHLADAITSPSPTIVHCMSAFTYRTGLALAEEFDADLVLQVASLEDCAGIEQLEHRHIGRIVCFTEPLADILRKELGIPEDQIELIRPGIPAAQRAVCFSRPDRAATIVCTAPFTRWGGVDRVIEAAHILRRRGKRPMFFLLGQGPFEAALRARARQLDVQSSVTFAHPGGDLYQIISGADLFLHAAAQGCLYLDALQAMGLGLAIVAVPDRVADFFLPGQTASVCDGETADVLANAVDDLLADRVLGHRLASNAIEHVRSRHSMSEMADSTGAMYRKLLLARSTFAMRE